MIGVEATDDRRRTAVRVDLTTVALTLVTGAAVGALGRLFTTGAWWPAALAVALTGHGTSWLARRMRLGATVAVLGAVVVTAVAVIWGALWATTMVGLPTMRTFTSGGHNLGAVVSAARGTTFPTRMLPGYELLGLLAIAAASILGDALAFRVRAAMFAVLPSLGLVMVPVALLPPGSVYGWTVAFVGAVGVFWIAHRVELRAGALAQFEGGTTPRVISPIGMVLTAVCVAITVALAPLLPRTPPASATTIPRRKVTSPLLEIQPLLTKGADVEQFTVDAPEGRYWRLTALDVFDGTTWQTDQAFKVGDGRLHSAWPHGAGPTIRQSFVIRGLTSLWLPSVFIPVKVDGHGKVGWDGVSQSLIGAPSDTNGFAYEVSSIVPEVATAALRTTTLLDVAKRDSDHYTALPPMPNRIFALARDVTIGAPTMFDRALTLQAFLRNRFTYAVVAPGHDVATLDRVLFTSRTGSSEQFAAAFAVLARAAGLPARVAVGFTPGDRGADGLWHVRGAHAEAWPEVFLGRYGWIPFEPTPGRRDAQSDGTGREPGDTRPEAGGTSGDGSPTTTTTAPPQRSDHPDNRLAPQWLTTVVLALLAGCLAWAAGVPTLHALRRRWRRRSVQTEADAVVLAFEEAAERLADAGLPIRVGETVVEHASRVGRDAPLSDPRVEDLRALADQTSVALYRVAPAFDAEAATSAVGAARSRADRIERGVLASAPPWRRVRWALDPRPRTPSGRSRRIRRRVAPPVASRSRQLGGKDSNLE